MKVTRYYASTGNGVNVKRIIQELLNIELELLVNNQTAANDESSKTNKKESRDIA